jgi:hypothetical protein
LKANRRGGGSAAATGRAGIVLGLVLLLSGSAVLADGPRISCFLIGNVGAGSCPFTGFFREDPLFVYSLEPIPADLPDKDKRKIDRQYFPRNREALIEYDFIVFSDARVQHFTSRQLHDLDYAFREAGVTSLYSFGPAWEHAFLSTILYDIVPIRDYDYYFHRPWRVSFRREREPVFTPFIELGMERVLGEAYGQGTPRQGTTVWADMVPNGWPWLVSWRPGGKGAGLAWYNADEFNTFWWGLSAGARDVNPYAIDLATNLILYSRGLDLISDILTRREARRLIATFQAEKLLVLSMMEWADMFGANTLSLSDRLTDLEEEVERATAFYLEQSYPDAIWVMNEVSPTVIDITNRAMELKDQALFWVYLTEWLAITSVSMVAGAVIWNLMVQRRAYRHVRSTRLRIADELGRHP